MKGWRKGRERDGEREMERERQSQRSDDAERQEERKKSGYGEGKIAGSRQTFSVYAEHVMQSVQPW